MRRHREARSSHLDSPDTVLLWAHRSEQCGYQRGGGVLTELLATVPGPHLQQPRSIQAPLRPRGAVQVTASPANEAW